MYGTVKRIKIHRLGEIFEISYLIKDLYSAYKITPNQQ